MIHSILVLARGAAFLGEDRVLGIVVLMTSMIAASAAWSTCVTNSLGPFSTTFIALELVHVANHDLAGARAARIAMLTMPCIGRAA